MILNLPIEFTEGQLLLGKGGWQRTKEAKETYERTLVAGIAEYREAPNKEMFVLLVAIPLLQEAGIQFVQLLDNQVVEVPFGSRQAITKIGQFYRDTWNRLVEADVRKNLMTVSLQTSHNHILSVASHHCGCRKNRRKFACKFTSFGGV